MREPWEFTARPPRHTAAEPDRITLTIRRRAGESVEDHGGVLIDFSRGGARFSVDRAIDAGTEIEMRLTADDGFAVRLAAIVRWHDEPGPQVTHGCQFASDVPWELLGELLLRGALTLDHVIAK